MSQQLNPVDIKASCHQAVANTVPARKAVVSLAAEDSIYYSLLTKHDDELRNYAEIVAREQSAKNPIADYKNFLNRLTTEVIDPMNMVVEASRIGRRQFVESMEALLNALHLINSNKAVRTDPTTYLNWELNSEVSELVKLCRCCLIDDSGKINDSALRIFGQFNYHVAMTTVSEVGNTLPYVGADPRGIIYTDKGRLVF